MGRGSWIASLVVLFALAAAPARAASPAPLSAPQPSPDISSSYGSGAFGSWLVDAFDLPVYRYSLDEQTAPQAARRELVGSRDAWHQVGNDRLVADAFNHGYTQLWDQERLFQWTNRYEPDKDHYAGGFGYLRLASGRPISTLYDDRPASAQTTRDFGAGYYARTLRAGGVAVDERVYAPFGDDPLLLHDVRIENESSQPLAASWFEYWDVNPMFPFADSPARPLVPALVKPAKQFHRGLTSPGYDPRSQTLSVDQRPSTDSVVFPDLWAPPTAARADSQPLSIFAAALDAPVSGFDTDTAAFFGSGGRAAPAAVVADRTSQSIAPPNGEQAAGRSMFAFRSPVQIPPHGSVTLRYAYGIAQRAEIPTLVAKYRAAAQPFADSERAWSAFTPSVSLGPSYQWLARELRWDAYLLRSHTVYDGACGQHVIGQGGYYQYGIGYQGSYRDPLMHALPMVYLDPALARDTILYSAQEQRAGDGQMPYGMYSLCRPLEIGTSDDMDVWLLLAASEYVLATRDTGILDQQVRYADHGSGTLWDHLKLAVHHQEQVVGRGSHGGYRGMDLGDWADFIPQYMGLTESMITDGQVAYAYRRLADVSGLVGDHGFASSLTRTAADLQATVSRQWNGRWFVRGYAGDRKIGDGAIYGDMQPWAILSGAASPSQSASVIAATRRFLTGIGAPGGPTKIGSAEVPANNDPGVTEHYDGALSEPVFSVGGNNAGYVGGTWQVVNGWLVWALTTLDGRVPGAADFAFDEWRRNTLATHAAAYPDAWDGTISTDDVCWSFYSRDPSRCGFQLSSDYAGQIAHQAGWLLWGALKLAGIDAVRDGYEIDPHFPLRDFNIRLPSVGLAVSPGLTRGYVVSERSGPISMRVRAPSGVAARSAVAWAGGRRVPATVEGGSVVFSLAATAGRPSDWAVSGP